MNQQIENEKMYNIDMHNFYNMTVQINSMDQLTKEGWKIILKSKKDNELALDKKVSIVSVLGNKNTGKSFILHLLTGKSIPHGYTITNEGLSFIIPDNDENKNDDYILIDTVGTDRPLLNDDLNNLSFEEKNKVIKDRQITDYFLQKFILEKSDIFICVVDNLTLINQIYINRIVNNYTYKTIFIVHNLKTLIEKEQVQNYIENTLMKSLTFELHEDNNVELGDGANDGSEERIKFYFKQEIKESEKSVIHLILANQDSEAGKYYNQSTIDYLNKQLIQVKEKKEFNVVKNLKEFLLSISGEIFNTKLEETAIKEENNTIKVNVESLDLKDCLIDDLGNNIIKETKFKPHYRCGYFVDSSDEKKFFLEIELFGIWKLKQTIKIYEHYFTLFVSGEKEKKIVEKKYEFQNYVPVNEFNIEIKIDNNRGIIKDVEPKIVEENGLYILIYQLKEKHIE